MLTTSVEAICLNIYPQKYPYGCQLTRLSSKHTAISARFILCRIMTIHLFSGAYVNLVQDRVADSGHFTALADLTGPGLAADHVWYIYLRCITVGLNVFETPVRLCWILQHKSLGNRLSDWRKNPP